MKRLARKIVVSVLGWQVRRLRSKHPIKIVGVVGSVGKTSTKSAIAQALGSKLRVRYQSGNYNDLVSVPLIFFGESMPSLTNPLAWLGVFWRNHRQINGSYLYDVVVTEIGTDGPGQIAEFGRYLELDIAVITAITPEHMEYFTDLDAVAHEEFAVTTYAKKVIANADLVAPEYRQSQGDLILYGKERQYSYGGERGSYSSGASPVTLYAEQLEFASVTLPIFSDAQLYSVVAAMTVWQELGVGDGLATGLRAISQVSGRMQLLSGIKNSVIIDDSYNASPEAVTAALDTLYDLSASYKIAVLGNMNELGGFSKNAHLDAGAYCDPTRLNEVITIGPDANEYLAQAARDRGCKVTTFDSPYDIGEYLKGAIQNDTLLLVKGSQNKVFAEESIKSVLENPQDQQKLVRQSVHWMAVKNAQFSK